MWVWVVGVVCERENACGSGLADPAEPGPGWCTASALQALFAPLKHVALENGQYGFAEAGLMVGFGKD